MSSISRISMATRVRTLLDLSLGNGKKASRSNVALLTAAVLLLVMPLDIDHLVTMALGAGAYWLLHVLQPRQPSKQKSQKSVDALCDDAPRPASTVKCPSAAVVSGNASHKTPQPGPKSNVRTESAVPVKAPVFHSSSWDAEVNELLEQIMPTSVCEEAVTKLAHMVKQSICSIFPDTEIESYICGNLKGGKAFGVAVPDVEFVLNICPEVLAKYMSSHGTASQPVGRMASPDQRQLQKFAIRSCTDRLVAATGIKFRRSAFTGDEPKVTFLAPANLGVSDVSVPFDFAINSVKPFRNGLLLAECASIDSRAKQLILLVRRWAKDRAICFAAKGHLSPYLWTILAIYYLQVGDCGPLLPPFEGLEISGDSRKTGSAKKRYSRSKAQTIAVATTSAPVLFKGFLRFYGSTFDWSAEVINIVAGKRAAPSANYERQMMFRGGDKTAKPVIEDPFKAGCFLGENMTPESVERLKEELTRANKLCAMNASLTTLLEPWAPSEVDPAQAAAFNVNQPGLDWRSTAPVKSCPGLLSAPVHQAVRLGPAAPGKQLSAPVHSSVRLGPPALCKQ